MAVRFDNSTVIKVQQANDIVELISEYVSLSKRGKEMVGLCPFHEDHRPSMYVNGLKQIFKCFACGAGGDVFKFVQMRENLNFPQAIERLAERAGIKLEPVKYSKTKAQSQYSEVDPNRLAKANAWAAKYFEDNLHDKEKGKKVREYLAERKITSASIKKWRIGLAVSDDDLIREAKAKKIPMELLVKAGLVTGQNHDKFINRLIFPISDVTGRIIGFGGRTLDGAKAKYVNSPATVLFDKSNSLYGLEQSRHEIVTSGQAVVVEGYTDCIMAHSKGFSNVVATLGTSFTAGHGRTLKRFAKKVILIYDSDVAGMEASNRALDVCLSQHIDIKIGFVPEGKDPCDFLLAAGKEKFKGVIEGAVDVLQFKWDRLMGNLDNDETLAGKRGAVEEFLRTIATAVRTGGLAAIDKGLMVNRLSKIIGLESKAINAELGKILRRMERSESYAIENRKVQKINLGKGLSATAQCEILEVLINEPGLFKKVKRKVTVENFDVDLLAQIASVLFEMLSEEDEFSLKGLLAKIESVEVGNCLMRLAQAGEEKGNYQLRLAGAVDTIERLKNQKQKSRIKTVEDQNKFLKRICENTRKQNPHNVGMK